MTMEQTFIANKQAKKGRQNGSKSIYTKTELRRLIALDHLLAFLLLQNFQFIELKSTQKTKMFQQMCLSVSLCQSVEKKMKLIKLCFILEIWHSRFPTSNNGA